MEAGATIGTGPHALITSGEDANTYTFSPTPLPVNVGADTFTILGHGFKAGEAVTYLSGSGTAIGGLENGKTYYISDINAAAFKLAPTEADATNKTNLVDITAVGTGSGHGFERAKPPPGSPPAVL